MFLVTLLFKMVPSIPSSQIKCSESPGLTELLILLSYHIRLLKVERWWCHDTVSEAFTPWRIPIWWKHYIFLKRSKIELFGPDYELFNFYPKKQTYCNEPKCILNTLLDFIYIFLGFCVFLPGNQSTLHDSRQSDWFVRASVGPVGLKCSHTVYSRVKQLVVGCCPESLLIIIMFKAARVKL